MYKLVPTVAAFALAGSAVAYAATSTNTTTTQVASHPPVYHEANTASPMPAPTVKDTQATNQVTPKKSGNTQASVVKARPKQVATAMPRLKSDDMSLSRQLDQVSSKIHSARQASKLTEFQYAQLHHGLALVRRNIEQAHDRYGREIPNRRLWMLDGQIQYLSTEVNKLVG